MIRKDERGYVLSGLGFLLLIPVIILIPIALSVQEHSTEVPNTFTKSDTLYNTFKAVQRDINNKVYDSGYEIINVTYKHNESALFGNNIIRLYNNTHKSIYHAAYGQTVDTFNIKPNYNASAPNMNNETGKIPLNNGIVLYYNLTGFGPIGSNIIYNYTFTTEIDISIELTKANSGHNQTFKTRYDFPMHVNATTNNSTLASDRINQFFNGVRTIITPYC